MNIGKEGEPIEVPIPLHPDQVPERMPAPEPVAPEKVPA
jgi:hypothetical protein